MRISGGSNLDYRQVSEAKERRKRKCITESFEKKMKKSVSDVIANPNWNDVLSFNRTELLQLKKDEKNRLPDTAGKKVKEDESGEQALILEREELKTGAEIITKPDGSRVLVVTMQIGGMETTMSIKISEPTEFVNDSNDGQRINSSPDQHTAEFGSNLP